MKKVAVYGAFFSGNFGDELMAVQFCSMLQSLGCDVKAYKLRDSVARSRRIEVSNSITELLEGVDHVLIGGGNLLSHKNHWFAGEYRHELEQLDSITRSMNLPVTVVSIGGEGKVSLFDDLHPGIQSLLGNPNLKGISVRLPSDIRLIRQLLPEVKYHADIVWTSGLFFVGHEGHHAPKARVLGFNLPAGKWSALLRVGALFLAFRHRYTLTWISTFPDSKSEYLPRHTLTFETATVSADPLVLLEAAKCLRVVYSHKLHFPMCALSMGSSAVSVMPHPKVDASWTELEIPVKVIGPHSWPGSSFTVRERLEVLARVLVDVRRQMKSVPSEEFSDHLRRSIPDAKLLLEDYFSFLKSEIGERDIPDL